MADDILGYDVTVVYPSYTRRIASFSEPHIYNEAGVPLLVVPDKTGAVHRFNMNKVDRYECKVVKKVEVQNV